MASARRLRVKVHHVSARDLLYPERPDIVIWSQRKSVTMIELTCPAEEGIGMHRPEKRAEMLSCVSVPPVSLPSYHRGWSARLRGPILFRMPDETRLSLTRREECMQASLCSCPALLLRNLPRSSFQEMGSWGSSSTQSRRSRPKHTCRITG